MTDGVAACSAGMESDQNLPRCTSQRRKLSGIFRLNGKEMQALASQKP